MLLLNPALPRGAFHGCSRRYCTAGLFGRGDACAGVDRGRAGRLSWVLGCCPSDKVFDATLVTARDYLLLIVYGGFVGSAVSAGVGVTGVVGGRQFWCMQPS
jgi:hypothetical protein